MVPRRVVIVGAGITGVCLARELATTPGVDVTVVERDPGRPRGSTSFAPGFVGLYNTASVLTDLARESAAVYDGVPDGFRRPGGLELAVSAEGVAELERRVAGAREAGLPARLLSVARLPSSVAGFVDTEQVLGAALFEQDGVTDPPTLTRALHAQASSSGATFRTGNAVVRLRSSLGGGHTVDLQDGTCLPADDVVLAGGIWGAQLSELADTYLPVFPVAHPYVYSAPASDHRPGPFVRWPERHAYARVHTDRLGIGSYDHPPVSVDQDELQDGAGLAWDARFDQVVEAAQRLLHPAARFEAAERVNGAFAVTPDNLPFVGPHPHVTGLWIAQALWITHAAGAARFLAGAMRGQDVLPPDLAVERFGSPDAGGQAVLREAALRLYRDIYANEAVAPPQTH